MAWFVGKLLDVAFFLAIGLATTAAAHSQSRDALADAARAFDEAALRADDDNAKPKPVRKMAGAHPAGFRQPQCRAGARRDFAPVRQCRLSRGTSALGQTRRFRSPTITSGLSQHQTFPGSAGTSHLCQKRTSNLTKITAVPMRCGRAFH
jgi:hypothetical protein